MARYAIIENNIVTNIAEADAEFAATQGWVAASSARIGDTYDGSFHTPSPPAFSPVGKPLTARQLRLGLVRNGISLAYVQGVINAIPDATAKDEAQIYWEFSTTINWEHVMTQTLLALAGIPVDSAKVMWEQALGFEK